MNNQMNLSYIPNSIYERYKVKNYRHAAAILSCDFKEEFQDIIDVLDEFVLLRSEILSPGGRKSKIASRLDDFLYSRGWKEKSFSTQVVVDGTIYNTPTHKVDCLKSRVAVEIEWNNKDPFYDRDLNNFRLLYDLDAISVGIIITRSDNLQKIFNGLGKGSSYGASTTHYGKLEPRIDGRGSGGCPVLVFAIDDACYIED